MLNMTTKRVLIVGGGFAGVKAALNLSSYNRFEVSLVSDSPDFLYYPAIYKTVTGATSSISKIPLSEIFDGKNVNLLQDTAERLNKKDQKISLKSGAVLEYDILILALGNKTNYFNIPGLKEYSYGIKSTEEVKELKKHLHQQLIDKRQPDLNYIVIGGGPTGIELASALPEYLRQIMKNHGIRNRKIHVDLVEAMPRLMPKMPKSVSYALAKRLRKLKIKLYLNTPVQAETANTLMMGDKRISSHTVIWTAGVTNNDFFKDNHFALSKNSKVLVDQQLQAWPGIYILGDNADTIYSGMAQTALRDADFVCENLVRISNNQKPKKYSPKRPICIIPVGKGWAAMKWGKFEIYGPLAWWLRKLADWRGYSEFEPWWKAADRVMDASDTEEACVVCAGGR